MTVFTHDLSGEIEFPLTKNFDLRKRSIADGAAFV